MELDTDHDEEVNDLYRKLTATEEELAEAEMFLGEWIKMFSGLKNQPQDSLIVRTRKWLSRNGS